MKIKFQPIRAKATRFAAGTATLALISGMAMIGSPSFADQPVSMAPPVNVTSNAPSDANSVFQWTEIPQNQRVPVERAVFDESGYQLYDKVGETILVPFTNNNLYVMKFAISPDDTTFFENEGDAPVLYLPKNGYLVNQSADGARWYPFTNGFAPTDPVFLGCAPSWHAFVGMGWYPGMAIYGGYWCGGPRFAVSLLTPSVGLFISIGGTHYNGWHDFHSYYRAHPAPFHVGFAPHDWHSAPGFRGGVQVQSGFHGAGVSHSFTGGAHVFHGGIGEGGHGQFHNAGSSHGGNFHGSGTGHGDNSHGGDSSHGDHSFNGGGDGGFHGVNGGDGHH